MGQIQSVLFTETIQDLHKASTLFSGADYEEALPVILRRLPLLDEAYINTPNISHGYALLARVYAKLHKYNDAVKTLEKAQYREQFSPLYFYSLFHNKNYEELRAITVHDTLHRSERLFCTLQQLSAQLHMDEIETPLLEIRTLLSNINSIKYHDWVLFRAYYFELENCRNNLSSEAEEAAQLMQKEITSFLKKEWYSSLQLPQPWKGAFIDTLTETFSPDDISAPSKDDNTLFPQPVPFEFEWALEKILGNMDDIPLYEISKTVGPIL